MKLGADVIEAGFPASSRGEFKATQRIGQLGGSSVIAALCRARREDIDMAWEALRGVARPRLHIFIATSDLHIRTKLRSTREQVLDAVVDTVAYARSLCPDVQFSAEDGARSDRDYLVSVYNAAIKAGASTINVVDTVGYMLPHEFGALVAEVIRRTGGEVVYGAHCHNDLGMAVANTVEAIRNGVTQIDCTVNGIGERAGNASLEELAMTITTRGDRLGVCHSLDTTQLTSTSALVASVTGIPVPAVKAVVGQNTFSHESGIHQHGVLADSRTYEIFTPQSVGIKRSTIVLGKLSGRHAFEEKAEELGYNLDAEVLEKAFLNFKEIAQTRRTVSDADVRAILETALDDSLIRDGYVLEGFQIQSGNKVKAMAMISLSKSGETFEEAAVGSGPIEAAFNCINRIAGHEFRLEAYSIRAVTDGRDALGEATVRISDAEGEYAGRGVSRDIIKASIRAYVNAINRIGIYRHRDM